MKHEIWITAVWVFLVSSASFAQVPASTNDRLTATEIILQSQMAFYYQGDDMKVKVTMELIDKGGETRKRVMTMLRRDEAEGGNQKYFIYFHEPGDIRQMTFMIWKYPEKEDDRWVFVPAVDLIRRIAADDKRSSFVGTDFTYEDVSGRDVDSDTHTFLREEKLDSRSCYVVESLPKAATDYKKMISWIDKNSFLPLKEEYYDVQDQLFRVFTADRIENISVGEDKDGKVLPTVTKRTMKNIKTGHRTEVTYTSLTYNLGLETKDFSERKMRRPPRSWIR